MTWNLKNFTTQTSSDNQGSSEVAQERAREDKPTSDPECHLEPADSVVV